MGEDCPKTTHLHIRDVTVLNRHTCLPRNSLAIVVQQLLLLPAVIHLDLHHLPVLGIVQDHVQVRGLQKSKEILKWDRISQGLLILLTHEDVSYILCFAIGRQ